MYNFVFSNSTAIYFGAQQRENLCKEIKKYGTNVLVVYGGNSAKKNGILDEISERLEKDNINIEFFSGICSNPRHTKVNEGAEICREKKIQVILAIGGGTVIDCAKAISVAAFYEGDCWDIISKKVDIENALSVITVLTVAGTGTEMNNSCVITNLEKKIKRGFSNELLRPKASFLDPQLTYSVTPFQTACGCADMLSHVLDAGYFLGFEKMDMLNQVMESICKTIIHYGKVAYANPNDYEARANLMWASTWALNGCLKNGIRQLAACHAIEHEVSACYDINHGLGMAIIMPRWIKYILSKKNAQIFARLGRNVFGILCSEDIECAKKMVLELEKFLFEDLKLPNSFSEIGITDEMFEEMAKNICWGSTLPGLKPLSEGDVVNIFRMCL